MITPDQIQQLEQTLSEFERPVLSLYATVNPGRQSTLSSAVRARVKNTLRTMDDLSDSLAQRVLETIEGQLPESRSIVIFADEERMEVLKLQLELVDDASGDRLEARLGEPYLTPLRAALSNHLSSLIVLAARDRVRIYHVRMGEIEMLHEALREPVAEEQDDLDQSKNRFPAGVRNVNPVQANSPDTPGNKQNRPKHIADRADAAVQLAHEHIAESQLRFYQHSANFLGEALQDHSAEHVLILGPDRDGHLLLSALPPGMAKRVKAVLPGLPDNDPTDSAVLEAVDAKLDEIEQARERALLDLAAEEGVRGAKACLDDLRQCRLHTLIAPEDCKQQVFSDSQGQYLAMSKSEAAAFDPDGRAVAVDLSEKLPEVADACGAQLEFVSGDARRRLLDDFDGMAGLRRW